MGLGATAVILAVAAGAMPWATYRSAVTGTVRFGGGDLGHAVLWLAVGQMVLALCLWHWPAVTVGVAAVVVGAGTFVVAAALALHSIARANTVYRYAAGPSHSAYAWGSGLGLLSAVGMIIIAAVTTGHVVHQRDGGVSRERAPRQGA